MSKHHAEAYLQVVPVMGWNKKSIQKIKAVTMTQTKPSVVRDGAVVIKVRIGIDDEVFLEQIPTVNIDVPVEYVSADEISVETDALQVIQGG